MCCFSKVLLRLDLLLAAEGQNAVVRREEARYTCHGRLLKVPYLNQTWAVRRKLFDQEDVKNCPYFIDLLIFVSDMTLVQWLRGTRKIVRTAWDFMQEGKKKKDKTQKTSERGFAKTI